MILRDKIESEVLGFVTKKGWKAVQCQNNEDNITKNFWIEYNPENFLRYIISDNPEMTEEDIEINKEEYKIEIIQNELLVTVSKAQKGVWEYFQALDNKPCLIQNNPDNTKYFEPYGYLLELLEEADIVPQELIEDFDSVSIAEYKEYNGHWQERYSVFYANDTKDFEEELGSFSKENFDEIFTSLVDQDRNEFELFLIDELELMLESELKGKLRKDYPKYYNQNFQEN